MPYWQRARAWAFAHTKTYTLPKAISPIVAAAAQWYFFRMRPMGQTILTIVTIFGAYVVLYAMEFTWQLLFKAPVALDGQRDIDLADITAKHAGVISERDRVIGTLQERLAAPKVSASEQKQRDLAAEKLKLFTDPEKKVLKHILQFDQQNRGELMKRFSGEVNIDQFLNKAREAGLIQNAQPAHPQMAVASRITPSFVSALKFHFHGE